MDDYRELPMTPPHSNCPLTPPATGESVKQVRFTECEAIEPSSKRLEQLAHDDNVSELLHQVQESASNRSNDENASASLPSEGKSATSVISNGTILDKHDPFAYLAIAIDAPGFTTPFPFMKLPLTIRTMIYKHLVTVPAIICVRQNHTAFSKEEKAFLYAERRVLRPGIAYALAQLTVDGHKSRFSGLAAANVGILCVSKQVYTEAKPIMYGQNDFEIVRPSSEMAPPPDFSVRLFPPGYQCLVTKLNIRIRCFYDLSWLLAGGYKVTKNYYRGLRTLTLILELDSTSKSYGKAWSRKDGEEWRTYVQRLHGLVNQDLSGRCGPKKTMTVPPWVNLRVLFSGEAFDETLANVDDTVGEFQDGVDGQIKRAELKKVLAEVWSSFKKSC